MQSNYYYIYIFVSFVLNKLALAVFGYHVSVDAAESTTTHGSDDIKHSIENFLTFLSILPNK